MDIHLKLIWAVAFLTLFFMFALIGRCAVEAEPTAPECRRYYQQGVVRGCDKCKANMQPLQTGE